MGDAILKKYYNGEAALEVLEHAQIWKNAVERMPTNDNVVQECQLVEEATLTTVLALALGAAHFVVTVEIGEKLDDGLISQAAIARNNSDVLGRETVVVTNA